MCEKIIVMLGAFLVFPIIKRLLIMCCSFCMLFDHLIQRDPAQLTFFKLCGQIDPYNLMLTNPSQSLRGYWDCLEFIRLVICDIQRAWWLTIKLFVFCFVQVGGTRDSGLSCLSSPVISWQLHSFLLMSNNAQLNHSVLGHSTGLFPSINLQAPCFLYIGQAFRYSSENAFYIFNQQVYFIIWYLLDHASLI